MHPITISCLGFAIYHQNYTQKFCLKKQGIEQSLQRHLQEMLKESVKTWGFLYFLNPNPNKLQCPNVGHLQNWRIQLQMIFYLFIYFYQLEANYFTILQWVLSYIDMNQPWIYMYSSSRFPLPPPSLPNPSESSQCTRPEHLSRAYNLGW